MKESLSWDIDDFESVGKFKESDIYTSKFCPTFKWLIGVNPKRHVDNDDYWAVLYLQSRAHMSTVSFVEFVVTDKYGQQLRKSGFQGMTKSGSWICEKMFRRSQLMSCLVDGSLRVTVNITYKYIAVSEYEKALAMMSVRSQGVEVHESISWKVNKIKSLRTVKTSNAFPSKYWPSSVMWRMKLDPSKSYYDGEWIAISLGSARVEANQVTATVTFRVVDKRGQELHKYVSMGDFATGSLVVPRFMRRDRIDSYLVKDALHMRVDITYEAVAEQEFAKVIRAFAPSLTASKQLKQSGRLKQSGKLKSVWDWLMVRPPTSR